MERKINRLQTVFLLIINVLKSIPLANYQTLMSWFAKFRLRIQNIITPFANEKTLISNGFSAYRLRHRLQNCQLSPLTSLQFQAVSFAACKEQTTENQHINPIFFASFFANNPN